MRFQAIILDHDDTAVNSTPHIHYPSHVRSMALLRPDLCPVDLDTFFLKGFDPGIMGFLQDELGMDDRELAVENAIWHDAMANDTPSFFEGFLEALAAYRERGGQVAVASHSESSVILRHYRQAGVVLEEELVFGWSADPARRKPSPYPVQKILGRLGLGAEEVLVVDDLRPGVEMAKSAGVAVAAAGWAHAIPAIRSFMEANCIAYFERVREFESFILQ